LALVLVRFGLSFTPCFSPVISMAADLSSRFNGFRPLQGEETVKTVHQI
jgi:hypothetical protein